MIKRWVAHNCLRLAIMGLRNCTSYFLSRSNRTPVQGRKPRLQTTTREGTAPGETTSLLDHQVPPMVSYSAKGINRFTSVNLPAARINRIFP
jgi:hypothetical protein